MAYALRARIIIVTQNSRIIWFFITRFRRNYGDLSAHIALPLLPDSQVVRIVRVLLKMKTFSTRPFIYCDGFDEGVDLFGICL